ncbi:MAG: MoxR family ATPase [Dehalococcoidia bacterium]|nr:MoxR family ATPase [Dehalococcoidia bacterium]
MSTTPPEQHLREQDVQRIADAARRFLGNVGHVIVGRADIVELCFVALLCEGHVLMEDVPGVGKTSMARAIARSIQGSFHRIQCTPDLLPSDVTGVHFFNQKTGEFEFRAGPVVAHIVLVDEINRATPRTQSCFLECMQERQVTADLETIPLPRPFMVIATQNPIELEGTFPLPEAQLDRFLLRLPMGYPSCDEEKELLRRFQDAQPLDEIGSVITTDELSALQGMSRKVYVEDSVRHYIAELCRATREDRDLRLGASPRATLALQQSAQALAAIRGRDFVLPDDVKTLAVPVLAHRVLPDTGASLHGLNAATVIERTVTRVPVPVD